MQLKDIQCTAVNIETKIKIRNVLNSLVPSVSFQMLSGPSRKYCPPSPRGIQPVTGKWSAVPGDMMIGDFASIHQTGDRTTHKKIKPRQLNPSFWEKVGI